MGDGVLILRRSLRAVCLSLIALLYVLSVPWYRDTQAPLRIWFGLPDWVTVALFCYAGVAAINAVAWFLSDVSDESEHDRNDIRSESLGREESPR